jgi:hypothetical protein
MARHVLGGPTDDGRASYQVAVTVCDECHRAWQHGAGKTVPIGSSVVEMARCDTQHIGHIPSAGASARGDDLPLVKEFAHVGHGSDALPSSDSGGEQDSGDTNNHLIRGVSSTLPSFSDSDGRRNAGDGHSNGARNAGDRDSPVMHRLDATTKRLARARQDVPPAVHRAVMRRDGGRCVVPGCRNGAFLDVHHINLRSEGGKHEPDGLIVICSAHHRAAHRGQLIIEGQVSTRLTWRHADGSRYGAIVEPLVAETHAQAFRALRGLGFREDQTRRAIAHVRADRDVLQASTESVLRAALGVLSTDCSRQSPFKRST